MEEEKEHHQHGEFSMQFIKDLLPFAMLIISGLVWGMKLEARYDTQEQQNKVQNEKLAEISSILNRGMLPITAEKILNLQQQNMDLMERVKILEDNCEEVKINELHKDHRP